MNGVANITWLYSGLNSVLGGLDSSQQLPPTIPGLVNPLLWWTTSGYLFDKSYHTKIY